MIHLPCADHLWGELWTANIYCEPPNRPTLSRPYPQPPWRPLANRDERAIDNHPRVSSSSTVHELDYELRWIRVATALMRGAEPVRHAACSASVVLESPSRGRNWRRNGNWLQEKRNPTRSGNVPGWTRTSSLRLRRPTLYPIELRGLQPRLKASHCTRLRTLGKGRARSRMASTPPANRNVVVVTATTSLKAVALSQHPGGPGLANGNPSLPLLLKCDSIRCPTR